MNAIAPVDMTRAKTDELHKLGYMAGLSYWILLDVARCT